MSRQHNADRKRQENRNGLFGSEDNDHFSMRPKRGLLSESELYIGDNLHELSDKQIMKLLQLKFRNNPLLLIRQLSSDLSAKESELILLRKEKFQREQELYRMCTEYGNLSRMEIDKRLNAIQVEDNVHKVVSEMIDTAIRDSSCHEGRYPPLKDIRHHTGNLSPMSPEVPVPDAENRTTEGNDVYSEDNGAGGSNNIAIGDDQDRDKTLNVENTESVEKIQSVEKSESTERTGRGPGHWYDWLNPSEEGLGLGSSTSLNRFRSLSLNNFKLKPRKVPVELESMLLENDALLTLSDPNIDRHGFYNDTTISKPPPRTPDLVKDPTFAEATISTSEMVRSIDKLKHLGERHDAINGEHVKKWDSFMREIRKEGIRHNDSNHELFGIRGMNLKKQDSGITKFFLSNEDEKSEESKNFKSLHRLVNSGGIPSKYRNELWFELSGAKNKEVPGEYSRLLESARSSTISTVSSQIEQINLDLHRTLPSNRYFNDMATAQPGPHFYKLQNILYAFVAYKPEVGYSQGMNKIVGSILLGVSEGNNNGSRLSEEDVFWIFVSLTEDCLPKYGELDFFHKDSLVYIQRDVSMVQRSYFPKYLPTLHQKFCKLGVEVLVMLLGWWLGVFTDNFVSVDLWFKFLDSLLISESVEIKFVSYSLSFFKLFERTLLEFNNSDDIYTFMNNIRNSLANQTNIRFNDLVQINNDFERHMHISELESFRGHETLGA